ncbi:MAG: DUF4178 domain-containing protein [Leptospiraceae bacterium]|nr:DUF4178 domain-containing protein [Leptospiraceae bacterium]MCK6382563.1 DUF4178 domain-containing protein [Leptospiraceae bacterium]NUM41927.1 DUF4178 domain-containing protein [Leptospiraceae bacterium]
MFELACPNCGSKVPFISKSSLFAVCPNCKSSSIRKDMDLETYGKVSELQDDSSPLQIGTTGKYLNNSFSIIGRIQLKYELGFWNEWYFIDDKGNAGWIGEAMGQFMVTRLKKIDNPEKLQFGVDLDRKYSSYLVNKTTNQPIFAGDAIAINKKEWIIKEITVATCVSGEGELPFKFDSGYTAVFADLSDYSDNFATLDFSEEPPLLFTGDMTDFDSLNFQNLKDPRFSEKLAGKEPKSISCTSCGAPLVINFPQFTNTVSCQYCGSVLDTTNPELKILSQFKLKEKYTPILPLGAKCNLYNQEYTVLGYMRRKTLVDKITYSWEEYLLYNPKGYIWLNCNEGHWMVFKTIKGIPVVNSTVSRPTASYHKDKYLLFTSGDGEVDYAIGEFYWRIKKGDKADLQDYVSPPLMLSLEKTPSEIIWTRGEYLEKEVVKNAFLMQSPLPDGKGIAPSQPNPHQKTWKRNWKIAVLSFVAAIIFQIGYCNHSANQKVFNKEYTFLKSAGDKSFVSEGFHLDGKEKNVSIEVESRQLNNNYIYFAIALINSKTDVALDTGIELSYYHGVDDGESWSEGSTKEFIIIEDVEEGDYYLRIEPESDVASSLRYEVTVVRDTPRYTPFILFLIFIFPPIFVSLFKYKNFESDRLQNSDYANSYSSSYDDSDDEDE